MHFGIITAGNENLILCKYLNELGYTYTIWYDSLFWPYDDKPLDVVIERIHQGIRFLQQHHVDGIFVHPLFELMIIENKEKKTLNEKLTEDISSGDFFKNSFSILPLFHFYLYKYCFKYSPIGKIGLVGTYLDSLYAQHLFEKKALLYQPTINQENTKKFNFPFLYWCKDVSLRNYLLRTLAPRRYLLTHIVKHDCRYFKDAAVDTLIPLQYSYLLFEKYLRHYIRKIRFHGGDVIKSILQDFLHNYQQTQRYCDNGIKENRSGDINYIDYVNVFVTGLDHLLLQQKKRVRLLGLGKKRQVKILSSKE